MPRDYVRVVTSDKVEFEVDKKIIRKFEAVHQALAHKVYSLEGGDGSVRLDRVNSSSFRKVLYWCAYHRDDADEPEKRRMYDAASWEREFFRISQSSLLEILLAATYLAFSDLRDKCCRVLSDLNKRKQRGGFREILKLPSEEGQSSITE